MTPTPLHVLFLCTHNSARSILAEALLNHLGQGRFRAHSAGSQPKTAPNPLALRVLEQAGIPIEGLRSKSWDEFAAPESPTMDLVITVCDHAASEACPYWPGHPVTVHWGYPDPSAVAGDEATRLAAFQGTMLALRQRIKALIAQTSPETDRGAIAALARRLAQP